MDNTEKTTEKLFYIFEYSFDVGIKTEALTINDKSCTYINSETYLARHFAEYFLFSYYRVGRHLGYKMLKNPVKNLRPDPALKQLLKNALNETNIEGTKICFDNITAFLANSKCHNKKSLEYLCKFMNIEMPRYEDDFLREVPYEYYSKQEDNWFNYLRKSIVPLKPKDEIVQAEGNVGVDNINLVYKINTLIDLWIATLYILYELHGTIKICKNCGTPFVIYKQKNVVYCSDRCKQEGRKARERERYSKERNRLYRNIYTKIAYKIDLCNNSVHINKWKEMRADIVGKYGDYKDDNIPEEEIIKWLKNVDEQYKKCKGVPFDIPDIKDD